MSASKTPAGLMRIGQLASLCGVSPDTLRHYERLGLLHVARRSEAKYRWYSADAVARVRLVQRALLLGFTLAELAHVLGLRDHGRSPCREVRALAQLKLEELEQRVRDLARLRDGLRAVLKTWDERLRSVPAGARAGLLDALVSGELVLDLPPRNGIRKRVKERNP